MIHRWDSQHVIFTPGQRGPWTNGKEGLSTLPDLQNLSLTINCIIPPLFSHFYLYSQCCDLFSTVSAFSNDSHTIYTIFDITEKCPCFMSLWMPFFPKIPFLSVISSSWLFFQDTCRLYGDVWASVLIEMVNIYIYIYCVVKKVRSTHM